MMQFELTDKDKNEIKKITRDILSKDCAVTFERVIGTKDNYEKRFVGARESDFKNRQKKERFTFFSRVEADWALHAFFHNIYNAKHIAKTLYMIDEDQKFTEQFDAMIPLGKVLGPDGTLQTTSVCELVMKKRDPNRPNEYFGMPFDIVEYRLIPSAS